jgi:hypothetical protein
MISGASAIERTGRTASLRMVVSRSPRTASANEKVFEDVFAFAPLQWSAAVAARDLPVELDVIALHTHQLVTRLAGGAVENIC